MFHKNRVRTYLVVMGITLAAPTVGQGQTDYYNTGSGRPIRVEDAHPVERFALEIGFAPLSIERSSGGLWRTTVEPGIAYGILPRTDFEISVPLVLRGGAGRENRGGLAGLDLGFLHNLNTETLRAPAFAITGGMLLPVGDEAPEDFLSSIGGIVTRSFLPGRLHLNANYTFALNAGAAGLRELSGEHSRWFVGAGVDHAFPLRSMMLVGDVFVERLLRPESAPELPLRWTAETGVRYQLDPHFTLDTGVGRRLNGEDQAWFFTAGLARVLGVRSLMPPSRVRAGTTQLEKARVE
ncbi:MAG: hypothetical protein LBG44_07635 [Gemmatimonadota bacterium]|jgi:hypothetical protein|nr:hypothetical protein [Gemmatimonadota bacterium]